MFLKGIGSGMSQPGQGTPRSDSWQLSVLGAARLTCRCPVLPVKPVQNARRAGSLSGLEL